MSATPTPAPGPIVATPSSLTFAALGAAAAQTVTLSEAGYEGAFSLRTACTIVSPVVLTESSYSITPLANGACALAFFDDNGQSLNVPVTVNAPPPTPSPNPTASPTAGPTANPSSAPTSTPTPSPIRRVPAHHRLPADRRHAGIVVDVLARTGVGRLVRTHLRRHERPIDPGSRGRHRHERERTVSGRFAACWALAVAAVLAGCGGGGASSSGAAPAAPATSNAPIPLTITITVPRSTAVTESTRRPAYISPSTQSITGAVVPAAGGPATTAVANCPTPQTTCAIQLLAPLGLDTFTLSLYDGPIGAQFPAGRATLVVTDGAGGYYQVAVNGN
jgi:hypothetical protein